MLPPTHRDRLEEFLQALEQLYLAAGTADNLEAASLNRAFGEVQQIFHSQILPLSVDDSNTQFNEGENPTATPSRIHSILTEIHRQMRLLQMDVTFLQASLQSATASVRLVKVKSSIETLIGYCNALLQNAVN